VQCTRGRGVAEATRHFGEGAQLAQGELSQSFPYASTNKM